MPDHPGPLIPPAGAPPGTVPQTADVRLRNLGTTCIVLAALEIVYALYKIGSSALSVTFLQWSHTASGPPTGSAGPMDELMIDAMVTFALVESGRNVPFVAMSVWLVFLGVSLRRGVERAVRRARLWAWCALAVVVLSAALSILNAVVMMQLQERMLAGTGASPASPGWNVELFSLLMGLTGAVVGAAVMATWPVVLLVWTGKLSGEHRGRSG